MKKLIVVIFLFLVIIANVIPSYAQNEYEGIKAQVVEVKGLEETLKENEPSKQVQNVTVRILEGEYENEEYDMVYVISENIENSVISNVELKEDENILVNIEEKDGEVINITYKETINTNYTIYVLVVIFIIALLVIGRKRATITYLVIIFIVIMVFIFSVQMGWNLIFISMLLSLIITTVVLTKVKGMTKKTILMIIHSVIGVTLAGTIIYMVFDIMGFNNINIKISEDFVNIKDLICSSVIVCSCGIYNAIMIASEYIFYTNNKPYKIKSDNIIEGQRSLKL